MPKLTLISGDGEKFVVEEKVAKMSKLISEIQHVDSHRDEIRLPTVPAKVLKLIIAWSEANVEDDEIDADEDNDKILLLLQQQPEQPLQVQQQQQQHANPESLFSKQESWQNKQFFANLNDDHNRPVLLFELIIAANLMRNRPLLVAACRHVAYKYAGMGTEDIRRLFFTQMNRTRRFRH